MKRVLFKILLPALLIAFWMDVAYYPSLKDGQLDYFTYWIIAGLPFGIKAIGGIFYPVGFDIICRDLPVIDLDEEERRWSQ